ncbi:MAG TPA: hypothetical protein VNH17_03005 [Streptosporangiaceae bacterium]|nr:hypothetical protein [Streptosporangiaceae bacterium]
MADSVATADPGTGGVSFSGSLIGGVFVPYDIEVPSTEPSAGIVPTPSAAYEVARVLKASPGNVYSVYAYNPTVTPGFLLLLNAATIPGDGAVTPLAIAVLPGGGEANIDFSAGPPAHFSVGIVAVLSSNITPFGKTTGAISGFITGLVA